MYPRVSIAFLSLHNWAAIPVIPVPALPPGHEWRYDRKVTFSRASNYVVKALADARNELVESNENNNRQEKVITVKKGAKPDLQVSKINFSPGKPWQNEEITFWVFVKNTGPTPAPVWRRRPPCASRWVVNQSPMHPWPRCRRSIPEGNGVMNASPPWHALEII